MTGRENIQPEWKKNNERLSFLTFSRWLSLSLSLVQIFFFCFGLWSNFDPTQPAFDWGLILAEFLLSPPARQSSQRQDKTTHRSGIYCEASIELQWLWLHCERGRYSAQFLLADGRNQIDIWKNWKTLAIVALVLGLLFEIKQKLSVWIQSWLITLIGGRAGRVRNQNIVLRLLHSWSDNWCLWCETRARTGTVK